MQTIVTVVGARPQFVKAATISRALAAVPGVREVLVHTGQHFDYQMSEVFFQELEIAPPTHNLGISAGTHGAQTGRMLEAVERVLTDERPDRVLVYGDTNSTLAGALAAAKLHIPVAHVEAGLRSFNRAMPEEVNRVLTDHLADLLFTPTEAAVEQLLREGLSAESIHCVGDVMHDALLFSLDRAREASSVHERLGLREGEYVLATVHRQENTDSPERLRAVVDLLARLGEQVPVVFPVHPRTRKVLQKLGFDALLGDRCRLVEPVGYLDMLMLESGARLVLTDSGGVQKEAYLLSVPCVTLRDETEWVELVELGWNHLLPPAPGVDLHSRVLEVLGTDHSARPRPAIYGDGHAAERIADVLVRGA